MIRLGSLALLVLCIGGCTVSPEQQVSRKPPSSAYGGVRPMPCYSYFPSSVYFAVDSSTLTRSAQNALREQAGVIACRGDRPDIVIEGHADERGTREYNLALGLRRAAAVRDYLIALGVAPDRVRIVSYGKERPAVSRSDEEAWSQNRRAVSLLVKNAP